MTPHGEIASQLSHPSLCHIVQIKNVRRFDSRKDLHSIKFKRRPRILLKLSFRELFVSNLSGLRAFDLMVISLS